MRDKTEIEEVQAKLAEAIASFKAAMARIKAKIKHLKEQDNE